MSIIDRINPVMLKELRQMVRNRSIVISLIGFLTVLFIASTICLTVAIGEDISGTSATGSYTVTNAGGSILHVIISTVTGILVSFAIPFMVMNRVAVEFKKENVDLQYTTLLPPRAFVDGKALCGVLLSAVIALAALPFLMLAYLLRGIDMFSILFSTLFTILSSVLFCYFAVGIGAAKFNIVLKRAFFIFFAYSLCSSTIGLVSAFAMGGHFGSGAPSSVWMVSPDSTTGLILAFFIYACIVFLLRANTVMLMTPANFNRNRPVRLSWLLVWGITLVYTLVMYKIDGDRDYIFIWGIVAFLPMFLFQFLQSVSDVGMYSRRVRAEISRNKFRRCFQYLFFDGGEGGVCFSLLIFMLTVLVLVSGFCLSPGKGMDADDYRKAFFGFTIIAGYLVSVPLIVRSICLFIPKLAKKKLILVFSAIVLVLLSVVPMLLSIPRVSAGSEADFIWKTVGNIPGVVNALVRDDDQLSWHFGAAMTMLGIGIVLTLPNLLKSRREFVPLAGTTSQHAHVTKSDVPE